MPEVLMPRLSDTMEEGTLSQWIKHPGDEIHRGDIIGVIETDKAAMDLEAYDEGVLTDLLVEEGASVPIGTPIAVIDGQAGRPAARPSGEAAPAEHAPAGQVPAGQVPAGQVPAGQVPAGQVPAGQVPAGQVPAGQPPAPPAAAAPVSPPPAPPAAPAPAPPPPPAPEAAAAHADGPPPGAPVAPQAPAPSAEAAPLAPPETTAPARAEAPSAPAGPAAPARRPARAPTSPLARSLARRHGIDLASLTGSGPGGRIVRADVEDAVRRLAAPSDAQAGPAPQAPARQGPAPQAPARQGPAPQAPAPPPSAPPPSAPPPSAPPPSAPPPSAPPRSAPPRSAPPAPAPLAPAAPPSPAQGPPAVGAPAQAPSGGRAPGAARAVPAAAGDDVEELPLTRVRRITAERMVASATGAPHFYLTRVMDAGPLLEFRAGLNARPGAQIKFSVTDLLIRACATVLSRHPEVNCSWSEQAIRRYRRVHVGVAVAIEDGLIVPVVRDADRKTLTEIASEAHDLADRARNRRLAPDEITGSTFSISNLGMYGIDQFTAVINPPEAAILAVGAITRQPVVQGEEIVIGRTMALTLSIDHRVVDGATGAVFLDDLVRLLEDPISIVI